MEVGVEHDGQVGDEVDLLLVLELALLLLLQVLPGYLVQNGLDVLGLPLHFEIRKYLVEALQETPAPELPILKVSILDFLISD